MRGCARGVREVCARFSKAVLEFARAMYVCISAGPLWAHGCEDDYICVRARVDARAAVNVQLNNVAVVGKIVRPAAMFSSSSQNPLY